MSAAPGLTFEDVMRSYKPKNGGLISAATVYDIEGKIYRVEFIDKLGFFRINPAVYSAVAFGHDSPDMQDLIIQPRKYGLNFRH